MFTMQNEKYDTCYWICANAYVRTKDTATSKFKRDRVYNCRLITTRMAAPRVMQAGCNPSENLVEPAATTVEKAKFRESLKVILLTKKMRDDNNYFCRQGRGNKRQASTSDSGHQSSNKLFHSTPYWFERFSEESGPET